MYQFSLLFILLSFINFAKYLIFLSSDSSSLDSEDFTIIYLLLLLFYNASVFTLCVAYNCYKILNDLKY